MTCTYARLSAIPAHARARTRRHTCMQAHAQTRPKLGVAHGKGAYGWGAHGWGLPVKSRCALPRHARRAAAVH
eukprot:78621-Chlamydomonas_euryale.AAC.4